MDRDTITAYAMRRLSDPKFRGLLTAVAADGSRPIIPAFFSDSFRSVLDEMQAAGGAANLIVPLVAGSGFFVIAMKAVRCGVDAAASLETLNADCTMGIFIARLVQDGSHMTYCVADAQMAEAGRAELVGVAE